MQSEICPGPVTQRQWPKIINDVFCHQKSILSWKWRYLKSSVRRISKSKTVKPNMRILSTRRQTISTEVRHLINPKNQITFSNEAPFYLNGTLHPFRKFKIIWYFCPVRQIFQFISASTSRFLAASRVLACKHARFLLFVFDIPRPPYSRQAPASSRKNPLPWMTYLPVTVICLYQGFRPMMNHQSSRGQRFRCLMGDCNQSLHQKKKKNMDK